jgi:predicted esterase YcpF (UPF0227 family)
LWHSRAAPAKQQLCLKRIIVASHYHISSHQQPAARAPRSPQDETRSLANCRKEISMSDIRPVIAGPTLDGYYQQLINQIHILRLAINPNATGQGGDLAENTQTLVHELVDELDELQRLAVPFMIALRQSLPSAAAIRAGQ